MRWRLKCLRRILVETVRETASVGLTRARRNAPTPCEAPLIVLSEIFKVSIDYLLGRTDDREKF